jgi:hypothetical protein
MSDRPEKRKIEFIESYWTGGELGSDYQWNDNHGELVRCKDCVHRGNSGKCVLSAISEEKDFPLFMLDNRGEWFCADGKRRDETT